MEGKIIIVALFLGMFLFGCVSPQDELEARFVCLKLSNQSFFAVPNCETQDSCFSKADSFFADVKSDFLSFESRQAFFEYKNRLAKSWWYLNQSKKMAQTIREQCLSNANLVLVPDQVNRLNRFLSAGFQSMDEADALAIAAMALERDFLAAEKIGLVKEEDAFDAFVILQANLNDLVLSEQERPKGVLGKMRVAKTNLNRVLQSAGFQAQFVSDTSIWDIVPKGELQYADSGTAVEMVIPLLFPSVQQLASELGRTEKNASSIRAMGSFPTFDFFVQVEKIVGERDSVASEFKDALIQVTEKKKKTLSNEQVLTDLVIQKIAGVDEKIRELDLSDFSAFDQNGLVLLVSRLSSTSAIRTASFDVTNLFTAKNQLQNESDRIRFEFQKITQASLEQKPGFGERLSRLKKITNELEVLENNVDFLSVGLREGVLGLCEKNVERINRRVQEAKKDSASRGILDQMAFFAESFKREKEAKKQLWFCSKSIELESLFDETDSQNELMQKLQLKTKECDEVLEQVFSDPLIGAKDLKPIFELWKEILEKHQESEDLSFECESALEQVYASLLQSPNIQNIGQKYRQIGVLIADVSRMNAHLTKKTEIQGLEKEYGELGGFFVSDEISIKQIGFVSQIKEKTEQTYLKANERFVETLSRFLAQTARSVSQEETVPTVNVETTVEFRMMFENPAISKPSQAVLVELPQKEGITNIQKAGLGIENINIGNGRISFWFKEPFPPETAIIFDSKQSVVSRESDKWMYATPFRAEVRRDIRLVSAVSFPKVRVTTSLPGASVSTERVSVIAEGIQKPFWIEDQNVVFFSPVKTDGNAAVYFSILNPVSISEKIEERGDRTVKKIVLSNTLNREIRNLVYSWENPGAISTEWEAYTEANHSLEIQSTGTRLFVSIPFLKPNEALQVDVSFRTNDQMAVAEEIKQRVIQRCTWLSDQGVDRARALLIELGETNPATKTGREQIYLVERKLTQLENEIKSDEAKMTDCRLLLVQIEKKIRLVEADEKTLQSNGFDAEAKELRKRLFEASEGVSNAQKALSSKNPTEAYDLALKARQVLEEPFEALIQKLIEKKEQAQQRFDSIALPNSAQENEYAPDWDLFNDAVVNGDYNQAVSEINLASEKIGYLLHKEGAGFIPQWLKTTQTLKEDPIQVLETIQKMEQMIPLPLERKLLEHGVVPPFTIGSLSNYKNRVEKAREKAAPLIQKTDELYRSQKLELLESFIFQNEHAAEEIQKDWNNVREDLAFAYEKLVQKASQAVLAAERELQKPASEQQERSLALAKAKLANNEYAEAILAAKDAIGPQKNPVGFFLLENASVTVFPLAIGIILAALWILQKKRSAPKERPRVRIERIPNQL